MSPAGPASPPDRAAVAALLEDLVQAYSPSGQEEKAIHVLADHLTAWGLTTETDQAGNLHVTRGRQAADRADVILLGHIDTVPGQRPVRWDDDGQLWGRGTVDAKGPLVAHALALARYEGPLEVRLVAAVGEETTSPGARHLTGTLAAPRAVVIAEPTGLSTVGLGYKGRVRARLAARCGPAHPGAGAPTAAELVLAGIDGLTRWTGNPERDPGIDKDTLRVVGLATGTQDAQDEATAQLDLRLAGEPPTAKTLGGLLPDGVELEVEEAVAAVRADPRGVLATALRGALLEHGHEPRQAVKTGTSDWNVVGPVWGCPTVAYGPGDSTLDHTPDERISLDEVVEAGRTLGLALGRLAGTVAKGRG